MRGCPLLVLSIVAHRGYSSVAPENTLAAVAAGMRVADWVEVDVAVSADGVPYVLHDPSVDRTTDGRGALARLRSDEVDRLDAGTWFSPGFAGQPVPRLTAVLDLIATAPAGGELAALAAGEQQGPVQLLLEIKPQVAVEGIVAAVRERGMLDRVLVQSFDEQVLRDVHALEPAARLGLLRALLDPDPVAVAQDFHAAAYNPRWAALAGRPGVVRRLQAAGVLVMPWTLDDPTVWRGAVDAGVDGIITDDPGELRGWLSATTPRA
jgi:glycerophosphoryl diester phosphodiesterase